MTDKSAFIEKAKKVKLIAFDVDGVLTDGFVYFSAGGDEIKKFSFRDIMGISRLRKKEKIIALISGEESSTIDMLNRKIKANEVFAGIRDKRSVIENLRLKYNLEPAEICYVGEDINDVPAMKEVGVPIAVANGHKKAKDAAIYITEKSGGDGAAREIADLITGEV